MSEFDQTCSQDDVAFYAPPAQTSVDPESCAAPTAEPEASPEPAYAGPAGGAADAGYGVFDHYADEPVCVADANDGAEGASSNDEGGQCVDPGLSDEPNQSVDPDEGGQCVDPGPANADEKSADDKSVDPKAKRPKDMTPEEREADKNEKMKEYATQSEEEKQKRWARANGKLSEQDWKEIQNLPPDQDKKQAMLQAGIDKLDYDDPRRAELEKIQKEMNGKNSRTGGAYEPGTPQTGCGSTVDEMLKKNNDPSKPAFPGYIKGGDRELPPNDGQLVTPKSGDVYELKDPDGNVHGHAGTFCVSSPDGKTWLTYDGGQQSRDADKQQIKLVMRNVSVDEKGQTIVGAPDMPSGSAADNKGRPVSATYDYEKMVEKYPSLRPPQ